MIKKMKKAETTRRRFISGFSLLSAGIILRPLSLFSQEENQILNIGSPANFLSDKLISNFQKGISSSINSITYDYNSNINFNNNNYDVLIGRGSYLEGLIDDDKIAELNKDLIPNNSFIDPKFNNSAFDKDRKYTIPLSYGAIGIAYRKSKFSEPPSTWRWLLDSDKYAGKIALLGDGRTLIQIALKYMGVSLNTNDPMWINQAEKLLKRQKVNIRDFGKKNGKELLINGEVDLAIISNEEFKEIDNNDIGFTFPREGSLIWQDCACISKASLKIEESHSVINSMLDPKNSRSIVENLQTATPNIMALDISKKSYKEDPTIFPNEQIMERYEDTSTILDFDYEMMIEEMWDNILDS